MNERLKKNLVLQGSILAIAGLISKVIGFIYRIPMANIMGNTGNGLYSVAFGLYNIALTLSSYSMPLAISKLMSARLAKGDKKNAHRLFHDALIFAVCTGLIASIALYNGAEFFAKVYHKNGLEMPLRVLAPTVFVVAMLGCCRGFFQGYRNMVPTAVSQVIEQIVNAIVSVAAAAYFTRIAVGENAAAYGAMGGTFGTLFGALSALVLFIFLFIARQLVIRNKDMGDMPAEDHRVLIKAVFFTVLPVIISQSIYQLGYTLDDLIFGNLMALKGVDQTTATNLQGVFNTQYNQMINLPTAIATAMASATLPSIVASHTRGEKDKVKEKTDTVIKVNMLIAIPSAIGLAVLAEPVMGVLFPKLGDMMDMAVTLLQTGSSAVVFYALSTLSTSILQGCDKMRLPVIHSGISLAIHVVIVAACMYFTDLGVYALVIGNVSFPLLVCILNCRSIVKHEGYSFKFKQAFVRPFAAACVMGIVTLLIYTLLKGAVGMLIAMIVSMIAAVAVYAVMLIVFKAVTAAELKRLIRRR
ncbi:MAG: polysaccharide biosynthesis protein [Lachnospiraceae bacterium]|nr:polysaccharide biosynthesis protein [Lachnospiraceae bacterium]